MAHGDFKDLHGRAASDKTFTTAKNLKYDGYPRGFVSVIYNFWWKVYYLQRNMNYSDVVFDNQQLGKEFGSGLLEKFENTNYISL